MDPIKPPLLVEVWGTTRQLQFSKINDVQSWLTREIEAWSAVNFPTHPRALKLRRNQDAAYAAIQAVIDSNGLDALSRAFDPIRAGTVVITDSPIFPTIQSVSITDPDAAAMAMIASRSDATSQLSAFGLASPLDLFARFVIAVQIHGSKSAENTADIQRDDLIRLKNQYDKAISDFGVTHDDLETQVSNASNYLAEKKGETDEEWKAHIAASKEDWTKLKLVYDTELGLRAPTTYWTERAISQGRYAIAYGVAFAASIAVMIAAFAVWGLEYLSGVSKDMSAIIAVLPIIIPAFAAIWILRILGRLLSESLSLMRDARERETLVKTFLALMKDESTGKSVVKEEDRILILHSLFRPSSSTSVDDSPPVHWFDILASRVGQKGKD